MSPSKYEHLLNVPFVYNKTDCYWLVKEFYQGMYNLDLLNLARYEGWEYDGRNLLTENYGECGFKLVELEENYKLLEEGDVLLMSLYNVAGRATGGVANHCAIYIGNGNILHSRYGQISKVERFRFKSITTHVLRHKDVVQTKKPLEKIDYMAMLSPAKRELLLNAKKQLEEEA